MIQIHIQFVYTYRLTHGFWGDTGYTRGWLIILPEVSLSLLFQNNFGNNRCRPDLKNYSSLMGLPAPTKVTKVNCSNKRTVHVPIGVQLSSLSFWYNRVLQPQNEFLATPELIQPDTIIFTWRLYRNLDYVTIQWLNHTCTWISMGIFGNNGAHPWE